MEVDKTTSLEFCHFQITQANGSFKVTDPYSQVFGQHPTELLNGPREESTSMCIPQHCALVLKAFSAQWCAKHVVTFFVGAPAKGWVAMGAKRLMSFRPRVTPTLAVSRVDLAKRRCGQGEDELVPQSNNWVDAFAANEAS